MSWWSLYKNITRWVIWKKSSTASKIGSILVLLIWLGLIATFIFFTTQFVMTADEMHVVYASVSLFTVLCGLFAVIDVLELQADNYFDKDENKPPPSSIILPFPLSATSSMEVAMGSGEQPSVESPHGTSVLSPDDPDNVLHEIISKVNLKQTGLHTATAMPRRRQTPPPHVVHKITLRHAAEPTTSAAGPSYVQKDPPKLGKTSPIVPEPPPLKPAIPERTQSAAEKRDESESSVQTVKVHSF